MIRPNFFLLTIFFSFFAIIPLINTNFPNTEEGLSNPLRLMELDVCIKDGVLFPRWFPDLYGGRGSPFFNFYAPLPYYVAELFHLSGFDYANSIKMTFALSLILSGVFMFLFIKELAGSVSAFAASVLYVYAPYHLGDVYVRGVLGESFAFAIFPLILYSIHRQINGYKRYVLLTAISYATLILTHNIMALVFTGFIVLYLTYAKRLLHKEVAIALVFGILLSAFFWSPALIEKKDVQIERAFSKDLHDYHVSFVPLKWFIPSYYLLKTSSVENPYVILLFGIFHFLSIIAAVFFLKEGYPRFLLVLLGVFVFLMTPYSVFIWENLKPMEYIQFPWRIFAITAVITSILGGLLTLKISEKIRTKTIILVSLLVIIASLNYLYVESYIQNPYASLKPEVLRSSFTNYAGLNYGGEYLPKGAVIPNTTIKSRVDVLSGDANILLITKEKCDQLEFKTDAKDASVLRINTFYFPGWTAYVDGKKEDVRVDREGLMELYVEKGMHEIKVKFENTRVRIFSSFLSLFTFIILLLYTLLSSNKGRCSHDHFK